MGGETSWSRRLRKYNNKFRPTALSNKVYVSFPLENCYLFFFLLLYASRKIIHFRGSFPFANLNNGFEMRMHFVVTYRIPTDI